MRDLSKFERGQIVSARLAGESDKPATLLGVSRATVCKEMAAYTNHGKTTSAKRNSGRKSTLTERDLSTLRIVSKNHRTAATQVTAELNIHLKDPVSKNNVHVNFTNATFTVGLQLLNL
jgi:transposase